MAGPRDEGVAGVNRLTREVDGCVAVVGLGGCVGRVNWAGCD